MYLDQLFGLTCIIGAIPYYSPTCRLMGSGSCCGWRYCWPVRFYDFHAVWYVLLVHSYWPPQQQALSALVKGENVSVETKHSRVQNIGCIQLAPMSIVVYWLHRRWPLCQDSCFFQVSIAGQPYGVECARMRIRVSLFSFHCRVYWSSHSCNICWIHSEIIHICAWSLIHCLPCVTFAAAMLL